MGALSSCRRPSVPIVLAAVAWGLLGGLTGACSGGGPGATGDNDAGATGETGTGSSGGDAATTPKDSGADEDDAGPDAALISNPGRVSCGEAECSLPAEACCATLTTTTCQAPGASCEGGGVQRCDEAADCEGGNVCCLRLDPDKPEATCEPGCIRGASRLQLCKTDAECPEGTCYVNRCAGGVVYRACAAIQGCTQ
jgi:hypothetical protein